MRQRYYIFHILMLLICYNSPAFCMEQVEDGSGSTAEITRSFTNLKNKEGDFLAPGKYKSAVKSYDEYMDAVNRSKPQMEIAQYRIVVIRAIKEVNDQVNQINKLLSGPLAMRASAIEVNAQNMAERSFTSADGRLSQAIAKIEDGKISEADQIGKESIILYRVSKISAIKSALIGSAQASISDARKRRLDRMAPLSFERATAIMTEVETALERGDSVTEDLKLKAEQGNYETRHAIYLATKIDTLSRDGLNWERLLIAQENMVRQATALSGHSPDIITNGPELVFTESMNGITAKLNGFKQDINTKDRSIIQLQSIIDSLNTAINEQQIRLSSMVENYQQDLQSRKEDLEKKRRALGSDLRKKLLLDAAAQAQTRFHANEAVILREDKEVIIRLIGIDFQAGKTDLTRKGNLILDKLGELLLLYPGSTVVVEGHTDASGKDEINQALSEERALAVKDYLQKNTGIGDTQITSNGFGSNRPIADNKTRAGRDQNRRIDIVILFSSEG